MRRPRIPPLFPYTTLFRSVDAFTLALLRAHVAELALEHAGLRVLRLRRRFGDPEVDDLHLALVGDRKSTRLNSSHGYISYAVFCLKKKKHLLATEHSTLI